MSVDDSELFSQWLQSRKEELSRKPLFELSDSLLRSLAPTVLYSVVWAPVCLYLKPQCATVCELAQFGAEKADVSSVLRALRADTVLQTDLYYTNGLKYVILGTEQWNSFLLKSDSDTFPHPLASVFEMTGDLQIPTELLECIIPETEEQQMDYFLKQARRGPLLSVAAQFDATHGDHWRLDAMHELCADIFKLKTRRSGGLLPLHSAVLALQRLNPEFRANELNDSWKRALLRLIPDSAPLWDETTWRSLCVVLEDGREQQLYEWFGFSTEWPRQVRAVLLLFFSGVSKQSFFVLT